MTQIAPVLWLTGLSGSGKTTIATELHRQLTSRGIVAVLLDGDHLREVFGGLFGHDRAERYKASLCYARLCKMLSDQGVVVVCATISMFHDTQAWNKANIGNYVEIHVKVPLDVLRARDSKGIYSRVDSGQIQGVIGVDIAAEEPLNPDLVIENHGNNTVDQAVANILRYYDNRF